MSIKSEATKVLAGSLIRTGKHLAREMVQLPSLNFRYNLVNKADKMMISGVHRALSMPANLAIEAKETMYEARKNKSGEDINFNNTTPYNLNEMLKYSQIQSHEPLYKSNNNYNDINLAQTYASMELASRARRNLNNNFKR
ncbi:TPA: hypothetical protein KNR75_003789 [Clostridioides difficile]|nr:hypothetical protein [Clostridioides difficile]